MISHYFSENSYTLPHPRTEATASTTAEEEAKEAAAFLHEDTLWKL